MSRVLALLVAVAMVVGAFYVRDRIEGSGSPAEPSQGEEPADGGGTSAAAGNLTLVCATEVAPACEDLEEAAEGVRVAVAPAGETAEQLRVAASGADAGVDLWAVPAPWPEMVGILRDPALPGLLPAPAEAPVLARSPLVLVGFTERLDTLAPACGGDVDWRCVGERAGESWTDLGLQAPGTLRPGHLDPTRSATGLLVLGQAVSSYAGRSDLSLADLQTQEFSAWLRRLEGAVPGFQPVSGSQLTEMLTRGLASYDVIGTIEAEAAPRLAAAAGGPQPMEIRASAPAATADVVLVTVTPAAQPAAEQLTAPLQAGLAGAGWWVDGRPPPGHTGDGSLPEGSGLPDAGLMIALQQRWEEAAP